MMEKSFQILTQAFKACTGWFGDLVKATGSQNIIIASFGVCLVIGLLFMPMRGHNVASWIGDYKVGKIHKNTREFRKGQAEFHKNQTQYYKSKVDYYKSKTK